jgi:hypothetical protein
MDENIPKIHTAGDFFMPGRCNVPVSNMAGIIFKYAPAAHQVYRWVLFKKSNLFVKSVGRAGITAIEPGDIISIFLLQYPL